MVYGQGCTVARGMGQRVNMQFIISTEMSDILMVTGVLYGKQWPTQYIYINIYIYIYIYIYILWVRKCPILLILTIHIK